MKFKDLTYKHGLTLSESKIKIRLEEIDFLGLHIKEGHIILQPHIAEKIFQFFDKFSSRKQIQRFLGIINYAVDLIQNLTKLTSHISKHLQKGSLPWSVEETKDVKELKLNCQLLPSLNIPNKGHLIFPTNANDNYWAAILIEKSEGNKRICGYKS